jgi:hypothetical protein
MLKILPTDILIHIKQFLTYKERVVYLTICSLTACLVIEPFSNYQVHCIQWPRRSDSSYLLVYHPFYLPYYSHPHTFLGNGYVSIIIYDTPYTYYHIRTKRKYEQDKSIRDYLIEYEPKNYFINKITKYIDA